MSVDTKRLEYIDFYFQKVQDTIKGILSKDDNIKKDDIQKFNDMIFTQKEYDVRKEIEEYVEGAASNAVDMNVVAQSLLDKYYDMVFVNDFNQDAINDVDNPLVEEGKLMKFSSFVKQIEK